MSAKAIQARVEESDRAFNKQKHIQYWKRCLKTFLPGAYMSTDSNRMMLAFFILSSLDLLDALDSSISSEERAGYIEWIYNCQHLEGGFRGSPGTNFDARAHERNKVWDPAHVPATYLALSSLLILKDPLKRVLRSQCLGWLRTLQRDDGSFGQTLGAAGHIEGGTDSRFGYCACMVRFILRGTVCGDVNGVPDIDVENLVRSIRQAQTYDGGISEAPFHEAHGGFTYCAMSSLALMRRLPSSSTSPEPLPSSVEFGLTDLSTTIAWLVSRQTQLLADTDDDNDPHIANRLSLENSGRLPLEMSVAGFNGRCNKIADTCYCFWVCGSLKLVDSLDLIDTQACQDFLLDKTQHQIGGFGKNAGDLPDIYHSCLGLTALSLLGHPDVKPAVASACFSQDALRYLESLPWRRNIVGMDHSRPQGFTYEDSRLQAPVVLEDNTSKPDDSG